MCRSLDMNYRMRHTPRGSTCTEATLACELLSPTSRQQGWYCSGSYKMDLTEKEHRRALCSLKNFNPYPKVDTAPYKFPSIYVKNLVFGTHLVDCLPIGGLQIHQVLLLWPENSLGASSSTGCSFPPLHLPQLPETQLLPTAATIQEPLCLVSSPCMA